MGACNARGRKKKQNKGAKKIKRIKQKNNKRRYIKIVKKQI
jgi:hypothetical protein